MRNVILLSIFLSLMSTSCGTLGITDAPHVTTAKKVWLVTDVDGATASAFPVFCVWDPKAEKYLVTFLTARHSIETGTPFTLEDCNGVELTNAKLLVFYPDSEVDLALMIVLSEAPVSCVSYTSSNHTLGDTIYMAGWILGRHLHMTQGLMSAISNCGSAQNMFGNSGGAVMDAGGCVVGVVSGIGGHRIGGPIPHMMYYVPLTVPRVRWMENFKDLPE